jgi:hypothetical protein
MLINIFIFILTEMTKSDSIVEFLNLWLRFNAERKRRVNIDRRNQTKFPPNQHPPDICLDLANETKHLFRFGTAVCFF